MKSFAEFLPKGTFEEVCRLERAGPGEGPNLRERLTGLVRPCFIAFLEHARDEGRLVPIEGFDNTKIRQVKAWNQFVNDAMDEDCRKYEFKMLIDDISMDLTWRAAYNTIRRVESGNIRTNEVVKSEDERIHDEYTTLVETIDTGCLTDNWRNGLEVYDRKRSMRLSMGFTNWRWSLTYFDMTVRDWLPYRDATPDSIIETKVAVPTGEMLAFDWIRIEEFSQAIEMAIPDRDDPDINGDDGKVEYSLNHAKIGMVHVSAGNSFPYVITKGDEVLVSHYYEPYDEDEEEDEPTAAEWLCEKKWLEESDTYSTPGRICCDLWWATIIDRENFLRILEHKVSRDLAEVLLDKYIAEHEVVQFKLRPGNYKLTFGSTDELFKETYREKDDGLLPGFEPILHMERIGE